MDRANPPLIAIVGPTAVGKSRLALALARSLGGEIINADSRQVYLGMDIGSAKPTPEERSLAPHHLLDVRRPDETFSLGIFLQMAKDAIQEARGRGRVPLLVGGSGQYVWALLEGWRLPKAAPNPTLRADLELQASRRGLWPLYQLLQAVAPQAAGKTDPKNPRRVIRALEVHFAGGTNPPLKTAADAAPGPSLVLGLTLDRPELYRRIDARVDRMMAQGFVEETRRLLDAGYPPDLPSMSAVGYRELATHIRGDIPLDEAVRAIKYATHRIARKQYAWFRPKDPRIHWIQADGHETEAALEKAREFLGRCDKIAPKEAIA